MSRNHVPKMGLPRRHHYPNGITYVFRDFIKSRFGVQNPINFPCLLKKRQGKIIGFWDPPETPPGAAPRGGSQKSSYKERPPAGGGLPGTPGGPSGAPAGAILTGKTGDFSLKKPGKFLVMPGAILVSPTPKYPRACSGLRPEAPGDPLEGVPFRRVVTKNGAREAPPGGLPGGPKPWGSLRWSATPGRYRGNAGAEPLKVLSSFLRGPPSGRDRTGSVGESLEKHDRTWLCSL